MRYHYLHIRKTGGTAMKDALRPVARMRNIVLHPHSVRLGDIPVGEKVFFTLREPVSRFVSGFNSRLRKGAPRNYNEWSDDERVAFEMFPTPNDLAEALSCPDRGEDARRAMQAIRHIRTRFTDWFGGLEELEARRDDILLIAFQDTLDEDFAKLVKLLNLPPALSLPADEVAAHRTPGGFKTKLSDLGRANIAEWYQADVRLYEKLREK